MIWFILVSIQKGEGERFFDLDVRMALKKMKVDLTKTEMRQLRNIGDHLIQLNKKRLVKVNHSIMELICSKGLITSGYQVTVEHPLGPNLICDIYAVKGEGVLIIEVETGFTPPSHALDPQRYNKARISSKIARFSAHSNKFSLATPIYNALQIASLFGKPSRVRSSDEVQKVRRLCARYYQRPPITTKQIRQANLHSIHVIDVDQCKTIELDPEKYLDLVPSHEKVLSPQRGS